MNHHSFYSMIDDLSDRDINIRLEAVFIKNVKSHVIIRFTECWSFIHFYIDPILRKNNDFNFFYSLVDPERTSARDGARELLKYAYTYILNNQGEYYELKKRNPPKDGGENDEAFNARRTRNKAKASKRR